MSLVASAVGLMAVKSSCGGRGGVQTELLYEGS